MKTIIQEVKRQIIQWPLEKVIMWSMVLTLAIFGWTSINVYESYADKVYMENGQKTPEFIRWHFLAHSDDLEDQKIKEQVKDAVMSEAIHWFAQANNIEECRTVLVQSLPKIQLIAENVLEELKAPYSVRIYYGPAYFSDRQLSQSSLAKYKEPILKAGQYDALRLVIGSGAGHNWWCLLFPPLNVGSQVVFEVPPQSEKTAQVIEVASSLIKAGELTETAKKKEDNNTSKLSVKPTFKLLEILKGKD